MDLKRQKTISLLKTIRISLNIQIDLIVYHSNFKTTTLACFPSKSLYYTVINFYLQKLLILTTAKVTTSKRTDIRMQTSVNQIRTITMCSTLTLDCWYDDSIIKLLGSLHCSNKMCSE